MRVVVKAAAIRFGRRVIFQNLSAVFPPKHVTALVGPSGSGKSSLLAAIAGFRRLSSGTISLETGSTTRTPSATSVTWIAQDSNTIGSRSALDNTMVGPLSEGKSLPDAERIAADALADVGLAGSLHTSCRHLSGGERQRVAVARALASTRPIILADEPTAALDEASTTELCRLFARASGRATIIVATHDPVMIAAASSVVPLREGV